MPEGHTIHRAARDQTRDLAGEILRVSSPQGRFTGAEAVDGKKLLRVEAYGKHLFYVFAGGRTVHVHLGLYGRFFLKKTPAPPPRPTTRMRLEGTLWTMDLVGPIACELVTKAEKAAILARLGPDPLRDDADLEIVVARLAEMEAPIGAALLDQSVLAGVGNVYRAEVLHLVRVHPETPARAVPTRTVRRIWKLLVGLLRRGVEERHIVTTRGATLPERREVVPRGERLHVYRRRACFTCGGEVASWNLRGRTSWACRACQPFEEGAVRARPKPSRSSPRTRARRTPAS